MTVVIQPGPQGQKRATSSYDSNTSLAQVNAEWTATSIDKRVYTATRSMVVERIDATVTVAGTDGGAVTLTVRKVPSGSAITAGTALHSGTANLKGAADTNQPLTLSSNPDDLSLAPGDSIALDFGGVLTSATGICTIGLCPK
jgi:hypothetical protein